MSGLPRRTSPAWPPRGNGPSSPSCSPGGGLPRSRPPAAVKRPAATQVLRRRLASAPQRQRRTAAQADLDRSARSAKRQAAYPVPARQPDAHGLTFLEQRAVWVNAAIDYNTRYEEFMTWATEAGLATDCLDGLDQALTEWMNYAFFQGRASADGSKLVAAVKHVRRLPMRTKLFPRACRAVRGWKKLAPPGSRLPLPWEVVCLIAEWMVDNNMLHQAELVVMLLIFYLRPKELFSLLGRQLVRPARGAS